MRHASAPEGKPYAVKDGGHAGDKRKIVKDGQQAAPADFGGEVGSHDVKQHAHDVQHDRLCMTLDGDHAKTRSHGQWALVTMVVAYLHAVEADKVVQLGVLDDGQKDQEEDHQGCKLTRVVHLDGGPCVVA